MKQRGPAFSAMELLAREGVDAVVIGGTAANIHGASRRTYDIDFCCPRDAQTFHRLSRAFNCVHLLRRRFEHRYVSAQRQARLVRHSCTSDPFVCRPDRFGTPRFRETSFGFAT